MTAIFIPTLNRPHKLSEIALNITETTPEPHTIYFILEESDIESQKAVTELGEQYILNTGSSCYADCINTAYHQTKEPYIFLGADDIKFYPGWLSKAKACFLRGINVVGTNDLHHPGVLEGTHATHYLVKRKYLKTEGGRVDMKDTVLYPYAHNYTDTEFIQTAIARGTFMPCLESKVEHMHWCWGLADRDETYYKGFNENERDRTIYEQRRHLWDR